MNHVPTLREVLDDLFRLLRDVAPERGDELDRELAALSPKIEIDEDELKDSFVATSQTHVIRVGLPCLKRQLAMAFAYVIVYRAMVAHAEKTGSHRFPLDGTPRVDQATRLLAWAMTERLRIENLGKHQPGTDEDWPKGLPFPHPESHPDSDERIALEIYYMALGVDLHHEFTHLRRGHSPGDAAIEQEIEADVEAAEWLLADVHEGDRYFDKRLLGVALSHLYDVFLKLEGFDSDKLHPPLVARLWNRIDQYARNRDHIVWAFVAAALSLHLEMSRRKGYDRNREFPTFRDQVDYLLNVYAPPKLEGL
jgi:hypothetical protein